MRGGKERVDSLYSVGAFVIERVITWPRRSPRHYMYSVIWSTRRSRGENSDGFAPAVRADNPFLRALSILRAPKLANNFTVYISLVHRGSEDVVKVA